jgi:osmotically-inducible protein OsmY
MKRRFLYLVGPALFGLLLACDKSDQERARQRAAEAQEKARIGAERARQEARRLGKEIKGDAQHFRQKTDQALQSGAPNGGSDANTPEEKIDHARQKVQTVSREAAAKLDRAGIITKVKTKLVTDFGLATATNVDVDAAEHVVTLRGTVSSVDQKQRIEDDARQVEGVTKVINQLQVQP